MRFALSSTAQAPGFTIAAILLALGIGANTAVFGLVEALLFRSPGYTNPSEIVQIYSQDKKKPKRFRSFSYPTYRDIREQNTVFTDVMAYNLAMVGIGEKGNAPHLRERRFLELLLRPRRRAGAGPRLFA